MRSRASARVWVLGLAAFGAAGLVTFAGTVWADGGDCSGYAEFEAVAAADGVSTFQSAPSLALTDADGGLPAAQAQVGSLNGSIAWAGAPYSATASENVSLAGANSNDVPVFAVSSFPLQPEAKKSTPGATLEARTDARSATSSVTGGAPPSDQASAGQVTAATRAACGEGSALESVADNRADAFEVGGVLRIGSVRSHARATLDQAGRRTLEATMEVNGATVLAQPVGITDRGVVTGTSATPLGDDPLAKALQDAGITVHYVAAVKDDEHGQAVAPGLEIVVTKGVDGVGSGPIRTVYTLGRATARAVGTADPSASAGADEGLADLGSPGGGSASLPVASGDAGSSGPVALPRPAASAGRASGTAAALPMARIADSSARSVYPAVATGALLVLLAWFLFEKLGVRFRWR